MKRTHSQSILVAVLLIGVYLLVLLTATYALFSDETRVSNHLEAGSLKLGLSRTALEWTEYDEDGNLVAKEDNAVVDLVAEKTNVFNISTFSPGLMQKATLELSNKGTLPFVYSVMFENKSDEVNALAEQINVKLSKGKTIIFEGTLASLFESQDEPVVIGEFKPADKTQSFEIEISFVNEEENNGAKDMTVDFDILVKAIQKTAE